MLSDAILLLCNEIQVNDNVSLVGMEIILKAVEGKLFNNLVVQKVALCVLVHCLCYPMQCSESSVARSNDILEDENVTKKRKYLYIFAYILWLLGVSHKPWGP